MYNMTQKVQLCLFTISQKHKWSLKTPQHQQLIFKIRREKVFEYKIKISFPLQKNLSFSPNFMVKRDFQKTKIFIRGWNFGKESSLKGAI